MLATIILSTFSLGTGLCYFGNKKYNKIYSNYLNLLNKGKDKNNNINFYKGTIESKYNVASFFNDNKIYNEITIYNSNLQFLRNEPNIYHNLKLQSDNLILKTDNQEITLSNAIINTDNYENRILNYNDLGKLNQLNIEIPLGYIIKCYEKYLTNQDQVYLVEIIEDMKPKQYIYTESTLKKDNILKKYYNLQNNMFSFGLMSVAISIVLFENFNTMNSII
ncbi:hypothetical protein Hokovirus_1_307 [Hokovirus HKV1]|uniref:Uncharacterized protein n=1 Tax=Hokovirus HKV1 TaxID=1977638 RepID=A0A1V0SFM6_9VIRU|nr:hypothetical protein Hokovirus_1_307 [Hokovirus HKV1]